VTDMLLTFQELCTFLKADEAVVLSLIESGGLPPPLNIGNRLIRWAESDLARWVQMGCPNFPPPTPEELDLIRANRLEETSGTMESHKSTSDR
jgi:predicted DNA-binding transcriptional regulator AlpA